MALFERYVIIDWSARNEVSGPNPSADALWLCEAWRMQDSVSYFEPRYFRSRSQLMQYLDKILKKALKADEKIFVGFDFAFGYPAGAAKVLTDDNSWEHIWNLIADEISDDDENRTNRFEVAAKWNIEKFGGQGPFWGHPPAQSFEGLSAHKPSTSSHKLQERRFVDLQVPSAQPVWKLAYPGSVGSQTLLGIKRLSQLRSDPNFKDKISVWPFETRFAEDLSSPIIIAEVYPSLFPIQMQKGDIKDAAQVRSVAKLFSELDREDKFVTLLKTPPSISDEQLPLVLEEEGWIVGAGSSIEKLDEPDNSNARPLYKFESDPSLIYEKSFETIKGEAKLDRFSDCEKQVVMRMIHACGVVEIARQIEISATAIESGIQAIGDNATIICDVKMVRDGIIESFLPSHTRLLCGLDYVSENAKLENMTRSAAGIEALEGEWAGSIIVIGNAPTALFHMLNKIGAGGPRPALIIGIPVGFVGAVESKQALASDRSRIPYITLHGRMGGSAIAAAALNAIAKQVRAQ